MSQTQNSVNSTLARETHEGFCGLIAPQLLYNFYQRFAHFSQSGGGALPIAHPSLVFIPLSFSIFFSPLTSHFICVSFSIFFSPLTSHFICARCVSLRLHAQSLLPCLWNSFFQPPFPKLKNLAVIIFLACSTFGESKCSVNCRIICLSS
jgi:hypothetical protein